MTTSVAACDHCDADVTFRPDPDHHLIMHVDVAHDDDCKFYLALTAARAAKRTPAQELIDAAGNPEPELPTTYAESE